MAKVVHTNITDDIDGSTEDVDTYHVGVAGKWYEIDLSAEHAEELLDTIVQAARPISDEEVASIYKTKGRKRGAPADDIKRDKETVAKAREWGRANGFAVSGHGRLSRELWAAFDAA